VSEPSWQPDPSGRHELRWFDGTAFTDQVADGGVQATDPGPAVPVAGVLAPSDVAGRRTSRVPLILAVVGALAVVVAVLTLLGDDAGDGSGTFEGEVGDDDGRHEISIPAGSVAVVEVEPSNDLDVVVTFELADADADRLEAVYEGTAVAGALLRRDVGFAGDDEVAFLAVPFDVDAVVEVSGFEGSEGDYEIAIEVLDLDVGADADGDELLDALVEDDDVPRRLRAELEAVLPS
jgi:hypothetical protein